MTHLTLHEELYETRIENNKIKAERDSLIDDIAVLRANEKRYRNRAENAMELSERINCEVLRLEDENERLRNNYNALTQHIRQKTEANPNEPRYIALVNYMNRLEKGES